MFSFDDHKETILRTWIVMQQEKESSHNSNLLVNIY